MQKLGMILSAGLICAACARSLPELREAMPEGGEDFRSALAGEYLAYAESEAEQYDWVDSEHFSARGLLVLEQEEFLPPQEPSDWNVSDSIADEAGQYSLRLKRLLAANREANPQLAARAQMLFECWLEQAEEGDTEAADDCREGLHDALIQLDGGELAAPSRAEEEQVLERPEHAYTVYFPYGSSYLTSNAETSITAIAAMLEPLDDFTMLLVGHTDRSGSVAFNRALAERRAEAVKSAFVELGIPAERIEVKTRGAAEPVVTMSNPRDERHNRRVEIQVSGY